MDAGLPFGLTGILLLAFVVVVIWGILRLISSRRATFSSNAADKPKSGIRKRTSAKSSGHIGDAIFISYRRSDSSDVTGRIYDRLVQHFGKENVFKDVDSIPLGVDFRSHLANSVGRCSVLLAVLGPRWAVQGAATDDASSEDLRDFVRIEIESALERNVPIIPVLVQGATMPRESDLPETLSVLAYHNAISIRPDPDFHQDCARLIKGIEHHIHRND